MVNTGKSGMSITPRDRPTRPCLQQFEKAYRPWELGPKDPLTTKIIFIWWFFTCSKKRVQKKKKNGGFLDEISNLLINMVEHLQ